MTTLTIANFFGVQPRKSDRLIPDNAATEARNVKLASGELRGLRVPELIYEFPEDLEIVPRRAFRLKEPDSAEFVWAATASREGEYVKSPLVNDAFDRWYIFEPDKPPKISTFERIKAGAATHNLKLYPPITAPTLALEAASGSGLPDEDRVYVMTYVTEWGEESAVSPAATITVEPGSSVRLSDLYSGDFLDLEGRDYTKIRVYRTVVGESSTDLYFVADITWGDAIFIDTEPNSKIVFNSTITSPNDAPPDGIYGARVHSSGALVAFKGRELYFSIPYLPHAWPEEWRLSLPDEVVAVEPYGENIIVLTKGPPAVVYGASPANLGLTRFPGALPCSNYEAVVGAPEGVYYPSSDGLVLIDQNGPRLVTGEIASREEWLAEFYVETAAAVRYESSYLLLDTDGSGFVFSADARGPNMYSLAGFGQECSFLRDAYSGQVYLLCGKGVYRWDPEDGQETTYSWKSREFYFPVPTNLAAAMIELQPRDDEFESNGALEDVRDYNFTWDLKQQAVLRAWADGSLVYEGTADNRSMVAMRNGFRATVWQFEVESQCRVHSVTVAESGVSLANG